MESSHLWQRLSWHHISSFNNWSIATKRCHSSLGGIVLLFVMCSFFPCSFFINSIFLIYVCDLLRLTLPERLSQMHLLFILFVQLKLMWRELLKTVRNRYGIGTAVTLYVTIMFSYYKRITNTIYYFLNVTSYIVQYIWTLSQELIVH